ncbi:hypothetical protein BDY17DRAFT_303854 [Neohortaea acidophila]|uniref:Uncharacterized protein n=1 Tax=Neohortaea acidophila TaxID=245834 RepID=A0A6A6PHD1_9PEZI|nr:uncharacterized protein BDY17DRAFT_303854 [Neohortaea acidophila]KAF2479428.1 hypothetical protein BDY17DRAFT_303854 [Neohortaea acidophila]
MAHVALANALVHRTTTPPSQPADEELYARLLRLRDVVVAGQHPSIKLPAAAIERLKRSLLASDPSQPDPRQRLSNSGINDAAFLANSLQPSSLPTQGSVPGLGGFASSLPNEARQQSLLQRPSASGLDPIFLEKSDSLIRAEGQLKRQRLERVLQEQGEQRKHSSRDRDGGADASAHIDIEAILLSALERVRPVSGLRDADKSGDDSSFDENDYYSSQVQSDWSSEASVGKGSDEATGAFTADFERLDGAGLPSAGVVPGISVHQPSKAGPQVYTHEPEDDYEPGEEEEDEGDEDDEYTPPDAAAFDSFHEEVAVGPTGQITPPEDDNSDYEPEEITDIDVTTPNHPPQASPRMQFARNHLTHIVAPQPNRVSPLATKGPTIELELVNGRPEVVRKPQTRRAHVHSRASTASPSGNGATGGSKKQRRNKKRKRDAEPSGRSKRRRERQAAPEANGALPYDEPYIKDEPVSPPPFLSVIDAPPYGQTYVQARPAEIDLTSPRYVPQPQYAYEPPYSRLGYQQLQAASPAVVRVASPSAYRPVQRDTQDLRRVASLHYAQRSPQQRTYSPVAPYRTASMTYGDLDLRQTRPPAEAAYHHGAERLRSPLRDPEHGGGYVAGASSPGMMPPPSAPARKIVVDQHGNRYLAAEVMPSPAPVQVSPYEPVDPRMAPPPLPASRRQPEQYVQANAYSSHDSHAAEPLRYREVSTSPVYQPIQGYEQFQPMPQRQQTAMHVNQLYAPARSYSTRPDEHQVFQPQAYGNNSLRHASVAPVQYARQDVPAPPIRAVSVMPSAEHGNGGLVYQQHVQPQQQRGYSQAPPGVMYVDQNGNPVFPTEIRQVRY